MTVTYGLLSTGFSTKPLPAIVADIDTDQQDAFGASFNTGSSDGKSVAGVVNGIMAESFANLWLLLEAIVSSQRASAATGQALLELCALTGTINPPATSSSVTLTLIGTNSTVVPIDSQVATASTNVLFETDAAATIATLASWAINTNYALDDLVKNAGNVYYCVQAGESLGSGGGPTAMTSGIVDNTVIWDFAGVGSAAVNVAASSVDTGPIVGAAGDITVIVNNLFGWDSAFNVLAASPGTSLLSDESLRTLRDQELGGEGNSPADAIRAALLKITGVTTVVVFMNLTDVTDVNGLPPHSVLCLVQGGANQDIWDALLANVAAGIVTTAGTAGTPEIGSSVDSNGVTQTEAFARPAQVPIYVDITLTYDAATYPSDGDTEVKNAIVAFGAKQSTGKDAVAVSIGAQAFIVPGVLDVPRSGSLGGTLISVAPGPTVDTTIAISLFELATFSPSNITVHSSPATP